MTAPRTSVFLFALGLLLPLPGRAQCTGDCGLSGDVTVEEIVRGVNIALGNLEVSTCPQFDSNGDREVTVEELVQATLFALNGCPPPFTATATATPVPTDTATISPSPTDTAPPSPTDTAVVPTATPVEASATPTSSPAPTVTETPTTAAASATATASSTPTAGTSAVCGNGFLEPGESCDGCALDCQIGSCTPSGRQKFNLHYSGSRAATSLSILIGYRSTLVSLPGMANQSTVGMRVTERPTGTFIVNDLNYALRTVLGGSTPKPAGKLYAVDFDRCQGSAIPTVADFGCTVEGCSDGFGPIANCACSVVTP